MVDYRSLRISNLLSPQYRHLLLLLFWAGFGLLFMLIERFISRAVWHVVWCPLDDKIPFCEWFFIPYLFWFVSTFGIHVYLLLFDIPAFRRFMYFIIMTYGITMVIYLIYPTCQELRPTEFARDNFMTRLAAFFYQFDTNTNVCPSLHCVGAMATAFGAWDTERFRKPAWKLAFFLLAVLISVSTLFVKQHSVLDVLWAWILCAVGYAAVYVLPKRLHKKVTAL